MKKPRIFLATFALTIIFSLSSAQAEAATIQRGSFYKFVIQEKLFKEMATIYYSGPASSEYYTLATRNSDSCAPVPINFSFDEKVITIYGRQFQVQNADKDSITLEMIASEK